MRNNHKLYKIWDKVPVTYYQRGVRKNLLQKIWHYRKINNAKQILKEISFKSLLDVGCASGFMISEIAKAYPGRKYFGVDIYDKAVKYAKTQYPLIQFYEAPGDKMPFGSNTLDLVLCYETIEHVEVPALVLEEIKRVLKKDGTLVLAMDSGNWLFRLVWFIWEKTIGKVWEGAHLHPFNHEQLGELILKSGFIIESKFFSHFGMEVVFILNKK